MFSSTCAIYSDSKETVCKESTPLSPYAYSKLIAEQFCSNYILQHSLNLTTLRYFTVYEPDQPSNSPYSGIIEKLSYTSQTNQPFCHFFAYILCLQTATLLVVNTITHQVLTFNENLLASDFLIYAALTHTAILDFGAAPNCM